MFSMVPCSQFLMPTLKRVALRTLTFLMLIIFLWPAVSWSHGNNKETKPGLSAFLDRNSAAVGSIVVLTLRYTLPEGALLPKDPEIRGLEGISIVERIEVPGEIRIKLLVDRLGPWKSGPLSLAVQDKDRGTQVLEAEPVSLTVFSNLGDQPAEAQLRPIQGIVPTQAVWLQYLAWGAGLAGLLLAGLGFFWWRRKRRAQRDFLELEDPPHLRALKQIEQLQAKGIFEKGNVKEFYFSFTEILRRYLESLRGFPAAEFTTEEIARYVDNQQDRKLLPLLREADLVKFADTIPTPARKEEDVKTALDYIQQTSPISEDPLVTEASYEVVE